MEEQAEYNVKNNNTEDIFQEFTDDDWEELKELELNTDTDADRIVEEVKSLEDEINRLNEIYENRVEKLKDELENKVEKLNNKNEWLKNKLTYYVSKSPNTKSTKTQVKLTLLSGDVIIKKAKLKFKKPKLTEEEILQNLPEYAKTKTELNWAEYKKILQIKDGRVVNGKTGQTIDDIELEEEAEKVVIK